MSLTLDEAFRYYGVPRFSRAPYLMHRVEHGPQPEPEALPVPKWVRLRFNSWERLVAHMRNRCHYGSTSRQPIEVQGVHLLRTTEERPIGGVWWRAV